MNPNDSLETVDDVRILLDASIARLAPRHQTTPKGDQSVIPIHQEPGAPAAEPDDDA